MRLLSCFADETGQQDMGAGPPTYEMNLLCDSRTLFWSTMA